MGCIVIALGILTVSVEGFYGGKLLALTPTDSLINQSRTIPETLE